MASIIDLLMINEFSLGEAISVLQTPIVYIIGMVIYSIFIFKFYKFISRKNIFMLNVGEHREHPTLGRLVYLLEYILLFPIVAFVWFFVISSILTLVSETLTITNIFMLSLAVTVTIRVTSYYNEELSRDVAKLLPLAMLAILLLNISAFSFSAPLELFTQITMQFKTLIYYFGLLVGIEFILRIITHRSSMAQYSPKIKE